MFRALHTSFTGRSRLARASRWVIALLLASTFAGPAAAEELVFLTWAEYIDPDLVAEFEAEAGVAVRIVVFELDEARDSLLFTRGPGEYDLMMINGAAIGGYVRRGWLARIAKSDMPNLRHLEPAWVSAYEETEEYAVPYFWGSLGIAYRSDLVSKPLKSWRDLMQPDESLRGRISMMGAGRDLLVPALKMLGKPINVEDPAAFEAAEILLLAQKPFVNTYVYLAMTEEAAIVTGDVWVSLAYNGGAETLRRYEPSIAFVVPEEGTMLWVDYFGISAGSPRKELAGRFIDFLNRPEVAARNALWVSYATPNLAAEEFLPSSFLENRAIYPDESVLERSEFYRPLSVRATKALNASMIRILH